MNVASKTIQIRVLSTNVLRNFYHLTILDITKHYWIKLFQHLLFKVHATQWMYWIDTGEK